MKKLIVANWKMHGSRNKIQQDLAYYATTPATNQENVIFALPTIYLAEAYHVMNLLANPTFKLSGQDVSRENHYGAFTGETSSAMLNDYNVKYCLIGHSERRLKFNDSDLVLFSKITSILINQITPIFCIGENLEVRNSSSYKSFLLEQLNLLLKIEVQFTNIIIAYEPIWSIGSGIVPNSGQIEEVLALVYSFMQKYLPHVKIAALYGGSVSVDNADKILGINSIGGVLVGGASLLIEDFSSICDVS